MNCSDSKPITYHLEYYPTSATPDSSKLTALLEKYSATKEGSDYAVFTTCELRPKIWKECERELKAGLARSRMGVNDQPDTHSRVY